MSKSIARMRFSTSRHRVRYMQSKESQTVCKRVSRALRRQKLVGVNKGGLWIQYAVSRMLCTSKQAMRIQLFITPRLLRQASAFRHAGRCCAKVCGT